MEPTFRAGTTVLGQYRIENTLGRDGLYVALRVSHPQLGELVLQMLLPESAISLSVHARFVREAQAAMRLRGEHVARLFDVGISSDGVPYLVTEAVRGVDLGAELARRGVLLPAEAVDYALQICDALAEAHAHGIVHRRVRTSSVLLTARADGSLLVKLLGFGIIHLPRPDDAGAAPYQAPEQLRSPDDADGRADIWAVGAVLHECLTGQPPGAASGPPALDPSIAPQVPPGLQAVVLRCLAPDREVRFPSIAALSAELAPYAHDHRMAGFLVERAHRLAQGVYDAVELTGAPGHPQAPAMLAPAASPGGSGAWTRRRYATIAVVALGLSIGGMATAALVRPGRSHGAIPSIAAKPVAGSASAGSAAPATTSDDGRAARLGACEELQRARRWQDLDRCATELGKLGASGKAEQLHALARQELQDEQLDDQARGALQGGDLRQAQAALQQIDPGSVYLAPLRAAFDAAEQLRTDAAHRQAEQLAAHHDCAGLRRLAAQLDATATDRVAAAAHEVTCREADADRAARPAPPPAEHATAAHPHKDSCDSVDVGELMTRAATQYDSGSPATALSLARVALGCKQTDRMFWLAVMYACAAHDLATAQLYFPRVPANLQPGIEHKCQQDNVDVRAR
ncbi:MAG TPA: protein kinase [Kofleriaceae bacterium]|jgi:serine/threonine-protein kinase|nr:protein kinase [Kofleriaceae bacterium]